MISPEQPNPAEALAVTALSLIGYEREVGGPGELQVFIKYDPVHPVILDDTPNRTAKDFRDTLTEQGVDMKAFDEAMRLLEDG